jgi:hypothetical protein
MADQQNSQATSVFQEVDRADEGVESTRKQTNGIEVAVASAADAP